MLTKNTLVHMNGSIYRILDIYAETVTKAARVTEVTSENKYLCIDCLKRTMPKWFSEMEFTICTEEELSEASEGIRTMEDLSAEERRIAHERYTILCGVLPFVSEEKMRTQAIKSVAEANNISKKTVMNHLTTYLAYQNVAALAPKAASEKKVLTRDQKNIRWALNKFYYTRHRNTLSDAYVMMLKERYTDEDGSLLPEYPSIHQFRYFYRQNKSLQKEYISRDGIKDYEMNNRPLLGDGVQQFAPAVGVGMLDATICDIYLVDECGNLVGRPVLVACVDSYSGMLCGYSLLWEGGMYSIRELLLNCITDKVEWCKQFGILIDRADWDCSELPGTLVTDMGSEFKSYNMEQIAELGCKIVNLPSFRAELKGPVEQIFNLAQNLFKPYLKGKGVIDVDFQKRGAHDYRKDACLTMEQFEQIILRCILYYNTKRVVGNFPYTKEMLDAEVAPHANSLWNYGRNRIGANLIEVSEEELVLTLLPRAEGKFTRYGLRVNKLRYRAEGYTEEFLKGGSVTVAYNPEDVSYVWLIENGEYIRFDLIESRFMEKPLSDIQQIQARQKALAKDCEEENIQARVELAQHIEAIASQANYYENVNQKGIRESRQRQRDKRHKDFVQKLQTEKGEMIYG